MLISNSGRFLITVILLCSGIAIADERILDYHSDVLIHADGSLMVTETIRVRAEGKNIRRGIYRDFPTDYRDRYGNRFRASFSVLDVQRNNIQEAYHVESRSNGVRVYIGHSDRIITPGIHEYHLRYHTRRQMGFFEDYDELYWNVTGNGWLFPIDHASASIELPEPVAADELRTAFYTGFRGADGRDASVRVTGSRKIQFESNRILESREGLTVSVGFPKGIVRQPTSSERVVYFMSDNGSALALLLGLLAPLGWYAWAWNKFGRDPHKGVIIPRFQPPEGLTPAGCSYIRKMSFNKQAFSAAIVSLGVKGYLEIHEDDDEFTLRKKPAGTGENASKGELAVLRQIFEEEFEVTLDQENYKVFMHARAALKKALKAEHLGRLFNLNMGYAMPAILMTIVAVPVAANLNGSAAIWILFIILTIIMHPLYIFLLRAPTPAGRLMMDEIGGFRMYLDTAEQYRLERMKSPQLTPELFESFLPYAFALGVENHWCERFTREFPEDVNSDGGYNPAWYVGNYGRIGTLNHLADNFNSSFSSAISSASSPPGSTSGSGGGGFSGGGGGGGGGGGW
jgi:uncharacterized membrane protein YgcG